MLTKKVEIQLRYQLRDESEEVRQAAYNELFKNYVNLVYKTASIMLQKKNARHYSYEDATQDGMLALAESIWDYDPDKGNKFSTFIFPRIYKAVVTGINNSYSVKVGNSGKDKLYKAYQAKEEWENLDTDLTMEEYIKEKAKVPAYQIHNLKNAVYPTMTWDYPIYNDEGATLEDIIPRHDSSFHKVIVVDYLERVDYLTKKEKELLYFDMGVDKPVSNEVKYMQPKVFNREVRKIYTKIRKHKR